MLVNSMFEKQGLVYSLLLGLTMMTSFQFCLSLKFSFEASLLSFWGGDKPLYFIALSVILCFFFFEYFVSGRGGICKW